MAEIRYAAVRRFDPADGENWRGYLDFSGLSQLTALVSLDGTLCPSVIGDLTPTDWQHNVRQDYLTDFFQDLDYLLTRLPDFGRTQVLAAMREPAPHFAEMLDDDRFRFVGFDLVDRRGGVSALVNCGGFPRAFDNRELSEHGLLTEHARAQEVRRALETHYPEERHAACHIWAIWRMEHDG